MATRNEIGDRMLFAVNKLNENEDPDRIPILIKEFWKSMKIFEAEFLDPNKTYAYPIGRSYGMPDD